MLDETEVWPVRTNAGFLFNALLHEDFGRANIDTGFIERNLAALVPSSTADDPLWRGAAMVALADAQEEHGDLAGFRLNAAPRSAVALGSGGSVRSVSPAEGEIAAVSGFADGERVVVFYEGQAHEFALTTRSRGGGAGVADGSVISPMPGRVTAVEVSIGDEVAKGQRLLTLEAMKMEHALLAPFDGRVAELVAEPGAQVSEGTVLARIEAAKAEPSAG
jgi:3-methylcrotonyl-CoA carboxylase alpha subunit